jgi:sarcosine oxidase
VVALVGSVLEGAVGSVYVSTDVGVIAADRVLLATGAFSGHGTSPAVGLDLEYALHTQLLAYLDDAEVNRLAGMPSIIGKFPDPVDDFYLTPPVRDQLVGHPSGLGNRHILKVGAPQDDHVRATAAELVTWFRTDGDPVVAVRLERILGGLLPGLRDMGRRTTSCVTTYTPSGFPFIDLLGDRVKGRTYCAIGGNGFAAKCAPALGELAAGLILGRDWPTEVDRELFLTRFRD